MYTPPLELQMAGAVPEKEEWAELQRAYVEWCPRQFWQFLRRACDLKHLRLSRSTVA